MRVTVGFFDVLGVQARARANIHRGGSAAREGCVALVSASLDTTAAERNRLDDRLDDAPCEVIGVMPEGFGVSRRSR